MERIVRDSDRAAKARFQKKCVRVGLFFNPGNAEDAEIIEYLSGISSFGRPSGADVKQILLRYIRMMEAMESTKAKKTPGEHL